jgi:tetratricopeptide (TPR) repeat protein
MHARILSVTALLLLTLASIPGAGQEPQPSRPLSRDWKRLKTPSLTVIGNASDHDLRRTAVEIERFRVAIRALAPTTPMSSPVPMLAVVFRDDSALTPFKPRNRGKPVDNVAAYFSALPDINYIVLAPHDDREFTYRVIFHEYTHFLVYRAAPRLPMWLNEGLADFYSTFNGSETDNRMILGRPIVAYRTTLRSEGGLIPFKKFLSSDALPELLKTPQAMHRYYAQSWAFTHYLLLGERGARRPKVKAFVAALQSGQSSDRAFAEVFGQEVDALERGLRAYLNLPTMMAMQLPSVELQLDMPIERLPELDVLQVQGDLLARHGAFDEADKRLSKAAEIDRLSIPVRLSRARLLLGQERTTDAVDILEAPDLQSATDFGTTFWRAEAFRSAKRYEDAIVAYRRALAVYQDSAPSYFGLSLSQQALGKSEAAANFTRCVMARPEPSWYYRRIMESQRLGLDTFVYADATSFVRQSGWQNGSSAYAMFVAALTAMRQQKQAQAGEILDEIAANVEAQSWQAAIADYLRGSLPIDRFLKKASPDELLTEAHAYIGIKAHIDGDQATALQHLRWVKEKGRRNYTEYGLALGELDRISRETNAAPIP